jgi:subtilisin family serine protease
MMARQAMEAMEDPRSDKQRDRDHVGVKRQLTGFADDDDARAHREELILRALDRRYRNPRRLQFTPASERTLVVPQELLVQSANADAVTAALGQRLASSHPVGCLDGRVTRIVLKPARGEQDALAKALRAAREVDPRASLNHLTPLGPIAKGRFGPELSGVPSKYKVREESGSTVPVAVIDTGITAERRTDGWLDGIARTPDNTDPLNVLGRDQFLDFGAGHGTFVTGVIQQVAGDIADIEVYRALDSDGVGSDVDVACALLRAVHDGARIVNLSVGTETDGVPPLALHTAIEMIGEMGADVLIVAAAGNGGRDGAECYPGAFARSMGEFNGVVAVAGLTADGQPADWSTRGDWVTFSAVAEGIVSTYIEGEESELVDDQPDRFPLDAWAIWTGTSFAAPQVVGEVALRLASDPQRSTKKVVAQLYEEGDAVETAGFGRRLHILRGTTPT